MPEVHYSEIIPVPKALLHDVIADYKKYPEFLDEIKGAKIVAQRPKTVDFELELIKKFHYRLKFRETKNEISWHLIESNLFKKNDGRWVLKEIDKEQTEAHYYLDIDFGFLVPKFIVSSLVEKDLPKMVSRFRKRAQEIASRKK